MHVYCRLRERGFSPVQTLAMIGVSVLFLVVDVSFAVLDSTITSDAHDLFWASTHRRDGP
ncbi:MULTISPECIES: hypothetical protein [unclassified Methylobacterium]|uniref:hypothetical protein n=1 Tax=unclassified Methylobacterium TaxID=2615210 RepID=UPI00035C8B47|nr:MULTISPECIES: hypothetical protein [Methylobacterium]WFT81241.1 hypothetical protein QA634_04890 [Methylobacterium nodulans]